MNVSNFYPQNGDSPACILSFALTAWYRGELSEAWKWNDGVVAASQNGSVDDKTASESAAGGTPETKPESSDTASS